jgi:hypothetical protein
MFPDKKVFNSTNNIKIHGMAYRQNLAVACGSECGLPMFAIISLIFIVDGQVFFLCTRVESWYDGIAIEIVLLMMHVFHTIIIA